MSVRYTLKDCSDKELLTGARELVSQEREATAQLIAHLSEIDERRLYLAEGCSSLFKYCTEVLHLSEPSAYNRIDVARIARKFPVIFEKLAEGSIHLSAVRILGPCLTKGNHLALLEAATHKSKEEVERIAVAMRPRPDVPSVVRKLAERAGSDLQNVPGGETELFGKDRREEQALEGTPGDSTIGASEAILNPAGTPVPVTASLPSSVRQKLRQPAVSALSPGRYKIEFTADEETYQALRKLQGLLAHQIPKGDPPIIFKKALLLLLEEVRREKLAEVKRPREAKPAAKDLWAAGGEESGQLDEERRTGALESRHIPAAVKRSVWKRDKGQCAFVGRNGRQCTERRRLEFHHIHAHAMGGPATIDNIALRCRAHNAHEARILFGMNAGTNRAANGSNEEAIGAANGKKLTRSGASSRTAVSSAPEPAPAGPSRIPSPGS